MAEEQYLRLSARLAFAQSIHTPTLSFSTLSGSLRSAAGGGTRMHHVDWYYQGRRYMAANLADGIILPCC